MATLENILISSVGIRNSLKKYKPLKSLAEYVWNGFDAQASKVEINITLNSLQNVESIIVKDDGYGIDRSLLNNKFKPFFQSEKVYDPDIKHSTTHGKNGVGRLTFFTFSTLAKWNTVYEHDNKKFSYTISVDSNSLNEFNPTPEEETSYPVGTSVSFFNIFGDELSIDTIKEYLAKEFCWFLELHKKDNFSIEINGEVLDYESSVLDRENFDFKYKSGNEIFNFEVSFVNWSHKLSEYSKYYYIQSDGRELAKENTTYNNKGDNFYHSVYIKSNLFDNFDMSENETISLFKTKNKKCDEFRFIIRQVNKILLDKRRPFLKRHVSDVIEALEIESAFPNYDKDNLVDVFKKNQIEDLVSSLYIAQPKIFSNNMNKEQKKTFIRLLDLIMESGEINSLFTILQEILDMDTSEREELSEILKFTRMSNVTKTIKLLKDRLQAVEDLKALVFQKDLNANEVNHIQGFIEKHYWLFGEQYNLVTAAEPNFEEALKRYAYYLHGEYEDKEIQHPDKLRQMDIFAVRQDIVNGKINNIVVELKHPDVSLGEKQLSQVKKYMEVILSISEFNASNMTWQFYLVGNRFSQNGFIQREIQNNKHHGEDSLVFSVDNYKIYVKTWSEVFSDFQIRYDHLTKILNFEQKKFRHEYENAQEVLDSQNDNSAVMPSEVSLA